jgi:tRNA(fMet)-specific endonuclease VapC
VILDTQVLIDALSPRYRDRLRERLAEAPVPLYTTAINWGELCHGLADLPPWLSERVRMNYLNLTTPPLQILHFDRTAGQIYGQLRRHLERAGRRLDDLDLMIASVALRYDMVLVSRNTRHFGRVPGLRVENWLTDD